MIATTTTPPPAAPPAIAPTGVELSVLEGDGLHVLEGEGLVVGVTVADGIPDGENAAATSGFSERKAACRFA